jgi:hypothetical protein
MLKRYVAGLALVLVTIVASHSSRADISYYVNQSGGIDFDGRDIDFTSASVLTSGSGVTAGLKMWKLELATNNGQSLCIEIRTAGDGTGDTRFWAWNNATGDFQSLNDDSNGGLYSMARVWIKPAAGSYEYANMWVTGFSSDYNAMKFQLNIWKLATSTTEAQCTQGSTMKQILGTQTLVNPT